MKTETALDTGRLSSLNLVRTGFLVLALLAGRSILANSLIADFARAQDNDPVYAAAKVENDAGRLQARIASMAFYPEGRVSASQLDIDRSTRRTVSLSQPILSYERWLTLKEVDPRLALTAVRLEQSQNELALRLFKAVSALSEAREKLSLNRSSIAALETQLAASRGAFRLGVGTITDVRDTEARIAQSRALTFVLEAQVAAARRQYEALIGARVDDSIYPLADGIPEFFMPAVDDLISRAADRNASIRAGLQAVVIAGVGVERARASYFPSVNFVAQRSEVSGTALTSSGVALRLELPIQAGTFFRSDTAGLELRRAEEQLRNQRQTVALEVEKLYGQVNAARFELAARREAVRAAELSFEASEQSFKGGVRTRVDVLNAMQAVFQAKSDYASAILRLGEGLVTLRLLVADGVDVAFSEVQRLVFKREP